MLSMSGISALLIILFISSIPAIAVFLWYRLAGYPFSLLRFSLALLTGAVSFFPALFLQRIFPAESGLLFTAGKWGLIVEIFVRIAFTEEFSRLIMLAALIFAFSRFSASRQAEAPRFDAGRQAAAPRFDANREQGSTISAFTMAGAAGIVAGLGFAILESAVYGASDPGNTLLRIFTAAPLHAACGFRVGSAVSMFQERPIMALFRFLSAVVIHGAYNFMLIIPGLLTSIAAILIALVALISAIQAISTGMKGEEQLVDTTP